MTVYTIQIWNQSDTDMDFATFAAPVNGGEPTPIAFPKVPAGRGWSVTFDDANNSVSDPVPLVGGATGGRPGRTGLRPRATAQAGGAGEPNTVFNIAPVVKFYVGDGNYQEGQVIDFGTLATDYAAIDFTGQPSTTATVVQAADSSFSVTYS